MSIAAEQAPTGIAVRPDRSQLVGVESIVKQFNLQVGHAGHFERAFVMASGLRMLRSAINKDMMADIMELQNSTLGFLTDKPNGPGYGADVVKECAIEVLLNGGWLVGNEFNIISGRAYLTKNYYERKVREFPGLTDLNKQIGTPQAVGAGALVPYIVTWKLDGKADKLEKLPTKLENGEVFDERICVKVNAGMGADAIIGKATRKMFKAVYEKLTGIASMDDGEVGDVDAAMQSSKTLSELTSTPTPVKTQTTQKPDGELFNKAPHALGD